MYHVRRSNPRQFLSWPLLLALAALPAVLAGQPANSKQTTDDEQTLKAAHLQSDGPGLVAFLKSRTLSESDREKVDVLIAQLGGSSFKIREKASEDLIKRGPVVLDSLREGLKSTDAEVQRRCEVVIKKIKELDEFPEVPAAVVRLMAARKPDNAVATLLDFLPFADNERVADEVRGVIAQLAVREGVADKAVLAALSDKNAVRRAAAVEALVHTGIWQKHEKKVRALLRDENAIVRWRVATALVAARDAEAVPTLINLLPEVSQKQAWEIEETLYRLSQAKPTTIVLGKDDVARRKCRDDWQAWWRNNGAGVDMAAATNSAKPLGFTTVIFLDDSCVAELYPNDTLRWQIDNLDSPLDVQVLDVNRVLIAEHQGNRVTERTFTGEIVWQHIFVGPQMAQRLPSGNTFIGGRDHMVEVDPSGKEIRRFKAPEGIMKCMKLPNNEIVCLCETGRVVRLDSGGREQSSFHIDFPRALYGGRIQAFTDGRVLIPDHHHNRVVECDKNGKVIWQVKVGEPIAATRLANGNTLVTSMTQNRAIEFNPAGIEVWSFRHSTRVTRAIRR